MKIPPLALMEKANAKSGFELNIWDVFWALWPWGAAAEK